MGYTVIGTLKDTAKLRKDGMTYHEMDTLLNGRDFSRWYRKNKKLVHSLALVTPAITLAALGYPPALLPMLFLKGKAIPVAAASAYSFWAGNGKILLDIMIIGFVTLVVTTFLKFTGRGDLAPLVVFVGGGIVLYEVLGLFKAIYSGIATFFQL